MSEPFTAARAGALDDVVISVATVRYDADTGAVRVDLDQKAMDGKSYVDLDLRDSIWLAYAVLRAAEELAEK